MTGSYVPSRQCPSMGMVFRTHPDQSTVKVCRGAPGHSALLVHHIYVVREMCSRQVGSPGYRHILCVIVDNSFVRSVLFPPSTRDSSLLSAGKASLREEGGTARLDGLDLGSVQALSVEAGGELRDVKVDAVGGVDAAEGRAGAATNTRVGVDGVLEGTVLLGGVAVGAEAGVAGGGVAVAVAGPGLGELANGRSRVRLGRVVDVGRNGSGTKELDEGSALGVDSSLSKSSGSGEHGDCYVLVVVGGWKKPGGSGDVVEMMGSFNRRELE